MNLVPIESVLVVIEEILGIVKVLTVINECPYAVDVVTEEYLEAL